MKTACNKNHVCWESKTSCDYSEKCDCHPGCETCKYCDGDTYKCTNKDAWPENQRKKVTNERVENG